MSLEYNEGKGEWHEMKLEKQARKEPCRAILFIIMFCILFYFNCNGKATEEFKQRGDKTLIALEEGISF